MKLILTLTAASLLAVAAPAQQYDDNGTDLNGGPGASVPGDMLQTFVGPTSRGTGLAHNGGILYQMDSYDGLAEVRQLSDAGGAIAGPAIPIANAGDYECGWDDKRELIVTCNASLDVVYGYTTAGVQVFAWPFPATGHVGVAWDCRRDVYWLSDWSVNTVFSLDANTGIPTGVSYSTAAYGVSRISDTLYTCGRNENIIAGFNAATGASVCSYPVIEPNSNAVAGLTVGTRGSVFTAQYANSNHYEQEACHGLRPSFRISPNFPVAGGPITMSMSGLIPGSWGIFAYSLTGCGPTPSPIGAMLLSNPRSVIATIPSNGSGVASLSANLPGSLAGRRVYMHGGGLHANSGPCNNQIINP